jgi:hypothetical protein
MLMWKQEELDELVQYQPTKISIKLSKVDD